MLPPIASMRRLCKLVCDMGRLLGPTSLPLGDPFRPDSVLLPWAEARDEAAAGGYRVSNDHHEIGMAVRLLEQVMRSEPWKVRYFVATISSDRMITLHRSTNQEVLQFLRWLISSGSLAVLIDDDANQGESADQDPMQPAWQAFDLFRACFGKEFTFAMRRYRLTTRAQVAAIRQHHDYDVVAPPEATATLKRMAADVGDARIDKAADELAKHLVDLRTAANAEGFVLLRAPVVQASRFVAPEEVVTPAKLKELRDGTFIAFLVVDEKDIPLPGIGLEVVLSDGKQVTLQTDDNGFCKADKIAAGGCEVTFCDFDGDLENALSHQAGSQHLTASDEAFDGSVEITSDEAGRSLPKLGTAKTHKLRIRTWIDVLIATDVPETEAKTTKAQFRLVSSETGYDRTLTSADDAIAGTDWVELLFEDVPRHGKYRLTSEVDGRSETVFDGVAGTTLGQAMDDLPASPPEAKTSGGVE